MLEMSPGERKGRNEHPNTSSGSKASRFLGRSGSVSSVDEETIWIFAESPSDAKKGFKSSCLWKEWHDASAASPAANILQRVHAIRTS